MPSGRQVNQYASLVRGNVKWSLKKAVVVAVSRRKRLKPGNEEIEYAVIQVGTQDDYDAFYGAFPSDNKWKTVKFLSLMCFREELYDEIEEGGVYTFSGKASFGCGNTYFCIEKAFDSLGMPVHVDTKEEESP